MACERIITAYIWGLGSSEKQDDRTKTNIFTLKRIYSKKKLTGWQIHSFNIVETGLNAEFA
jgi:hypothetical protein